MTPHFARSCRRKRLGTSSTRALRAEFGACRFHDDKEFESGHAPVSLDFAAMSGILAWNSADGSAPLLPSKLQGGNKDHNCRVNLSGRSILCAPI
jgi:hypothetical protein